MNVRELIEILNGIAQLEAKKAAAPNAWTETEQEHLDNLYATVV